MDQSLDDYMQQLKTSRKLDMSLDDYIVLNNIPKVATNNNSVQSESGLSKFDRYRNQDDDMDEDDSMPKLVPYAPKTMSPKQKSVRQRLGHRGSVCESINTSNMKLYRPQRSNFKAKTSVQQRLGKTYVNPAVTERNRIALHTLNTFTKNGSNVMVSDDLQGQILLNAFRKAIANEAAPVAAPVPEKKYDMKVQKEISYLQQKQLYYSCPGGLVVSNDGPGLRVQLKVPNHATDISMNQRFA